MTAETRRRRVALCADDFGLSDAASLAILDLGAQGALSANSVAVDGPAADAHASALRTLSSRLSIGLHFNVTENPHLRGPRGIRGWILASWLRRLDRSTLEREIKRQLDRFETLLGQAPTHVDGHEHVHQFPGLREPLLDAVARRYGAATVVRCTWPRHFRGGKAALIGVLGARAMRRGATRRGLACNTDFAGVYDLKSDQGYAARMSRWLRDIEDGGVIMCHPESDQAPGSAARRHEYAFLRSAGWPELQARWQITLMRQDSLHRQDPAQVRSQA